MANILKQIADLFDQRLDTNVILMAQLILDQHEHKADLTPIARCKLLVYYGDSLFNVQQFVKAEAAYSQALQLRKFLIKTKSSPRSGTVDSLNDLCTLASDVDIKFKMHQCYLRLRQPKRAVEILQSIAVKCRTPRVNMALGNLYREAAVERSAIACYKEVLRECPLAIEAAEHLLRLGVEGAEINSIMLEATCGTDLGWVNVWLRGQAQMCARDFSAAIATFHSLDSLSESSSVLANIGICYYCLCDDSSALKHLRQAYIKDPNMLYGKCLLARLLANSVDKVLLKELERMVNIVSNVLDCALWSSDDWVMMGYYMFANKKYERAAYFAQQAFMLNPRNIEARLLTATTFMQINSYSDALTHFREIYKFAPQRLDAHKGIVECCIAVNKIRDALSAAALACKLLNNSPQALTLYASVLMKEDSTLPKVRGVLERALAAKPQYSPAVWLLAEYLGREQLHEEATKLLLAHVEKVPSSKSHQLLADVLARLQRDDEAFIHYNMALRMDLHNQLAVEGLNSLGRGPSKVDPPSYIITIGPNNTSYVSQRTSSDLDSDSDWPSVNDFIAI